MGVRSPISGSTSTLASKSSIPIAGVEAPRFSFQACSITRVCIVFATPRHVSMPRWAAMAPSRLQPAQHIAVEWVCTGCGRGIPDTRVGLEGKPGAASTPSVGLNNSASPRSRQPAVEEHVAARMTLP